MINPKEKAALVSNISNASLIIGKLIVGFFSGSVSIISEAIHSSVDLIASIIAFVAIRKADVPPDKEHRYGHGKYEDVSGLVEGVLIFVAAGWIIYEAVHKILFHKMEIEMLGLGIIIMFISAAMNFIVSAYLYKIGKQYDSIALEADALHLRTDVYTSLGVFIGLLLIQIFKKPILDPIIAIIVALIIIKASTEIVARSFKNLTDYSLSEKDLNKISEIINNHKTEFIDFHRLRSRKSGADLHLDLHLTMNKDIHLEDAHKFCDHLEQDIKKEFPHARTLIHLEPSEQNNLEAAKNSNKISSEE